METIDVYVKGSSEHESKKYSGAGSFLIVSDNKIVDSGTVTKEYDTKPYQMVIKALLNALIRVPSDRCVIHSHLTLTKRGLSRLRLVKSVPEAVNLKPLLESFTEITFVRNYPLSPDQFMTVLAEMNFKALYGDKYKYYMERFFTKRVECHNRAH